MRNLEQGKNNEGNGDQFYIKGIVWEYAVGPEGDYCPHVLISMMNFKLQ